MKISRRRLQNIINTINSQTRKKYKKDRKTFKHTNTYKSRKDFNLHNISVKKY